MSSIKIKGLKKGEVSQSVEGSGINATSCIRFVRLLFMQNHTLGNHVFSVAQRVDVDAVC